MKTTKTNHTKTLTTPGFSPVDHSEIDQRSMPSLVAWSSSLWVIRGRNWKAAWIYIVRRTKKDLGSGMLYALQSHRERILHTVYIRYGMIWLDMWYCILNLLSFQYFLAKWVLVRINQRRGMSSLWNSWNLFIDLQSLNYCDMPAVDIRGCFDIPWCCILHFLLQMAEQPKSYLYCKH